MDEPRRKEAEDRGIAERVREGGGGGAAREAAG